MLIGEMLLEPNFFHYVRKSFNHAIINDLSPNYKSTIIIIAGFLLVSLNMCFVYLALVIGATKKRYKKLTTFLIYGFIVFFQIPINLVLFGGFSFALILPFLLTGILSDDVVFATMFVTLFYVGSPIIECVLIYKYVCSRLENKLNLR